MRLKAVILSLLIFLVAIPINRPVVRSANAFNYALIGEGAVLYTDRELTVPLTSLPSSYFVIILGEGETSYRVSYLDIDGFISKGFITPVDYEPKSKYASPMFKISNDGQPANIRSAPDHTQSNVVTSLSSGSEGIYYGTVNGSALIPEVGDLWYYVRYSSQPYLYGYVYKSQATFAPIDANVIERVDPEPEPTVTPSDGISYVIVAILTIPAIIIMLFVFKKPSSSPRTKRND